MNPHCLTVYGERFLQEWQKRYPETLPISYQFKWKLPTRWIRIYSLPDAQRYPNDKTDWDILLSRQNTVIDHLITPGTPIQWVWNWLEHDSHIFKAFPLARLGVFQNVDAETEFESWLLDDTWKSKRFDTFLIMIADESMRAFMIAPDCLIAPYDGGMDIVFNDALVAQDFKRHFADWVSPRDDGC
jgi:hypothetical protein